MNRVAACVFGITAMLAAGGFAQEAKKRVGEPDPGKGSARLFITPNPLRMPRSLKELSDASSLIVDATVKSVLPAREPSPRTLETDVVLQVRSAFKGSNAGPVVVLQRGGTLGELTITPAQYSIMKPGERYLLFLTVDDRPGMPPVPGSSRYLVTGVWTGLFRFENGRMEPGDNGPDPLLSRYAGLSFDQITSELRTVLQP